MMKRPATMNVPMVLLIMTLTLLPSPQPPTTPMQIHPQQSNQSKPTLMQKVERGQQPRQKLSAPTILSRLATKEGDVDDAEAPPLRRFRPKRAKPMCIRQILLKGKMNKRCIQLQRKIQFQLKLLMKYLQWKSILLLKVEVE